MINRHGSGLTIIEKYPYAVLDGDRSAHSAEDRKFEVFSLKGMTNNETVYLEQQEKNLSIKGLDKIALRYSDPPKAKLYSRILSKIKPEKRNDPTLLIALGHAISFSKQNSTQKSDIPAAYTYIGQFLAHEITKLHKTDGSEAVNLRTPSLDLDSIFGDFDEDADCESRYIECKNGELRLGPTFGVSQAVCPAGYDDIPRSPTGRPCIADSRNDDHVALSQTHVIVMKFFNTIRRKYPSESQQFVKDIVISHFQHAVIFDYMRRFTEESIFQKILNRGRKIIHAHDGATPDNFVLPIEIPTAFFRFGHSMVRDQYAPWNGCHSKSTVKNFWDNTYSGSNLKCGKLQSDWVTDWETLIGLNGHQPIKAAPVNTNIARNLINIPDQFLPEADTDILSVSKNIAARTLLRGFEFHLPHAHDFCRYVNSKLDEDERFDVIHSEKLFENENEFVKYCFSLDDRVLRYKTPIWYYVLKETDLWRGTINENSKLGPLTSRIICETLLASIESAGFHLNKNDLFKKEIESKEAIYGFREFIHSAVTGDYENVNVCFSKK